MKFLFPMFFSLFVSAQFTFPQGNCPQGATGVDANNNLICAVGEDTCAKCPGEVVELTKDFTKYCALKPMEIGRYQSLETGKWSDWISKRQVDAQESRPYCLYLGKPQNVEIKDMTNERLGYWYSFASKVKPDKSKSHWNEKYMNDDDLQCPNGHYSVLTSMWHNNSHPEGGGAKKDYLAEGDGRKGDDTYNRYCAKEPLHEDFKIKAAAISGHNARSGNNSNANYYNCSGQLEPWFRYCTGNCDDDDSFVTFCWDKKNVVKKPFCYAMPMEARTDGKYYSCKADEDTLFKGCTGDCSDDDAKLTICCAKPEKQNLYEQYELIAGGQGKKCHQCPAMKYNERWIHKNDSASNYTRCALQPGDQYRVGSDGNNWPNGAWTTITDATIKGITAYSNGSITRSVGPECDHGKTYEIRLKKR